jgi:hypothetical protein
VKRFPARETAKILAFDFKSFPRNPPALRAAPSSPPFASRVIVPRHLREVTLSTGSSTIAALAMAGRHNGEITR